MENSREFGGNVSDDRTGKEKKHKRAHRRQLSVFLYWVVCFLLSCRNFARNTSPLSYIYIHIYRHMYIYLHIIFFHFLSDDFFFTLLTCV